MQEISGDFGTPIETLTRCLRFCRWILKGNDRPEHLQAMARQVLGQVEFLLGEARKDKFDAGHWIFQGILAGWLWHRLAIAGAEPSATRGRQAFEASRKRRQRPKQKLAWLEKHMPDWRKLPPVKVVEKLRAQPEFASCKDESLRRELRSLRKIPDG